jgi:hypothetical protein
LIERILGRNLRSSTRPPTMRGDVALSVDGVRDP